MPLTWLIPLSLLVSAPLSQAQTVVDGQGALDRFEAGMNAIKAQDFATARQKFDEACQYGVGTACFNVGMMYLQGDGVVKSEATAFSFFEEGCRGREEDGKYVSDSACFNIGVAYDNGLADYPVNHEKAKAFYARACAEGLEKAC